MSVLTYRWQLEYENTKETRHSQAQYKNDSDASNLSPVYHKVSIDSIHKHCLIVPFHNQSQFVMEIIDQEHWSTCFSEV